MKKFVLGFLLGLLLGSVVTVAAHTARGYMRGWKVTERGWTICTDPYVNPAKKEIACEEKP